MTHELDRRSFLRFAATGAAGLLLPVPRTVRPAPTVFDMGRGLRRNGVHVFFDDRNGRYEVRISGQSIYWDGHVAPSFLWMGSRMYYSARPFTLPSGEEVLTYCGIPQ